VKLCLIYVAALGVVGLRHNLSSVHFFINYYVIRTNRGEDNENCYPHPEVQGMETRRTRGVTHATPLGFVPLRRGKGPDRPISHITSGSGDSEVAPEPAGSSASPAGERHRTPSSILIPL